MRAYEYLFYRLYCWASRWRWDTTPQISAYLMLVVLTGANIQTFLAFADLLHPLSFLTGLSKAEHGLCLVAIGLPQYFLVLFRGKFKHIAKRYASESASQSRRGGVIVCCYIVLSLSLPIVAAILKGIKLGTL